MTIERMGDHREAMALGCMKLVEDFAENMRNETRPFYIVFFAKPDASIGGIRQTIKAYYHRPAKLLGLLVWYVNNPLGQFEFVPELSSPPDTPVDESMLSTHSADSFTSVMDKAKGFNVLVS